MDEQSTPAEVPLVGHTVEPVVVRFSDSVTIIRGDCRDVMPVECDAVVTDPPYKGYDDYAWEYHDLAAMPPCLTGVHGFWCWSGGPFPLAWTARHVWSKANRNIGKNAEQYEEVYEVNGGKTGLVFRHAVIDSDMNATLNGDIFLNHPCQKPIRLIQRLVDKTKGTVCDPFMGSGTTGVACIRTGRKAILIELNPQYVKLAQGRGGLFCASNAGIHRTSEAKHNQKGSTE